MHIENSRIFFILTKLNFSLRKNLIALISWIDQMNVSVHKLYNTTWYVTTIKIYYILDDKNTPIFEFGISSDRKVNLVGTFGISKLKITIFIDILF